MSEIETLVVMKYGRITGDIMLNGTYTRLIESYPREVVAKVIKMVDKNYLASFNSAELSSSYLAKVMTDELIKYEEQQCKNES